MRERNRLASLTEGLTKLTADVAETNELIELAEAEGDEGMTRDALAALADIATEAKKR